MTEGKRLRDSTHGDNDTQRQAEWWVEKWKHREKQMDKETEKERQTD